MQRIGWLLVFVLLGGVAPSASEACSTTPCRLGELVPGSGATVPANLAAIEWLGFSGGTAAVSAARVDGDVETPVGATLEGNAIVLGESLVEGGRYIVRAELDCEVGGPGRVETEFTVAATAPSISDLGTLTSSAIGVGPVTAITYLGSCSLEVDADRTRVELDHGVSALPWRDALIYETWVDGAYWRPSGSLGGAIGPRSGSWIGRGEDVLYAVCFETDLIESEGLPEGEHTVELRARVVGDTTVLATPTATITLDCTSYEAPDGGGVGFGVPDVGPVVTADAGVDASTTSESVMGCSARAGAPIGWAAPVLVTLALLTRRRADRIHRGRAKRDARRSRHRPALGCGHRGSGV